MTAPAPPSYAGHRFPAEIISHAVWLYFRFPPSLRHLDGLLAAPPAAQAIRAPVPGTSRHGYGVIPDALSLTALAQTRRVMEARRSGVLIGLFQASQQASAMAL